MSVGVEGGYLFRFSLGGKKDFIDERDFISFTMIEEAGNVLPTFALAFDITSEDVLPILNEGNTLQVSFGRDRSSLVDVPLAVTGIDSGRSGANKRRIICTGTYGARAYTNSNKISITSDMSGVAAIKSVTSGYFKWKGNVDVSEDSMKWVQYNVSDRAFVNKIWLHSWIEGSFIAIGISSDGNFILKDMKKDIATPYKWRFGKTKEDPNRDIVIDGDPQLSIKSGLINSWIGYGREKMVYNLETSEDVATLVEQEPIIALTNRLAKNADIQKRFAAAGIQNDNTHENYWEAYLRNLTNLAAFHNVGVSVSFHNEFKPVKVLDQVMYKEVDIANNAVSSEFLSGVYYVTKVSRTIQESQLVTVVTINREALNQVKTGLV